MKVKQKILAGLSLAVAMGFTAQNALASGDHDHGHDDDHNDGGGHGHEMSKGMSKMDMGKMDMGGMFLKKKTIDGYTVSFHVMQPKEGMGHGGSHNLMVKVEQGDKALGNLKVNSKVVHPNGKAQSKMLMKMGDWYMAGYDLGHPGRHQMMILFKTADGAKHSGGIYYPE